MSDFSDDDSDASTISVTYNELEGKKLDFSNAEDLALKSEPSEPREPLPNGRRCHSALPWSVLDVTARHDTREDEDFGKPQYVTQDTTIESWPCSIDIEGIAARMNAARKVVPVLPILKYGRMQNETFMLTTEILGGYPLHKLVSALGEIVYDYMRPQIVLIVERLASVGISHNDLHPRNILIDARFNIIAIFGWAYSSAFNPEREYASRALSKTENHSWDHIFLQHVSDPLLSMFLNPVDGSYPPHGHLLPSAVVRTKHSNRSRELPPQIMSNLPDFKREGYVRIVVLASDYFDIATGLLTSCTDGQLDKASVELIVTDRPPLSEWKTCLQPPRILSLQGLVNSDPKEFDEQKHFNLLTSTVLGARPDVIVLLGWKYPLTLAFWKSTELPRVIKGTAFSTPVLFVTDTPMEEFPNSEDPVADYYHAHQPTKKSTEISATMWVALRGVKSSPVYPVYGTLRKRHSLQDFRKKIFNNRLRVLRKGIDLLRDPLHPPKGRDPSTWESLANRDA